MRYMEGKIICCGMHKTGITSLQKMLEVLGYKVRGGSSRLLVPILKGNFKPVLKTAEPYDAVRDIPWYNIYRELDELIPGSKFILTIREEESWYQSVSKAIGDIKRANTEWLYGRGKGLPKYHKENTLRKYREHNQGVIDYFKDRPDDLLVLNLADGDGWEKLCPFLGKDIIEGGIPHLNTVKKVSSRAQHGSLYFEYWRRPIKTIKNNFKIWSIDIRGLWPKKNTD